MQKLQFKQAVIKCSEPFQFRVGWDELDICTTDTVYKIEV